MLVKEAIDEGKPEVEWWEANFPAMVRYHKGFERYSQLRRQPPDRIGLKVFVLCGPTNVGKSHWVRHTYPDAFWAYDGKWYDGYSGQSVLYFDDYRSHYMQYDTLLRITDIYPYRLQIKGSTTPLCATTIIFSSNHHPSTWYPEEDWMNSPFRRRIHRLIYCHSREMWEDVTNQ